ncbi:MAG: exodeoxyribonuclease V subunit alpha [Rhodanobacteraceae bacterium]
MSAYPFVRPPSGVEPAEWRALDRAVACWVRLHGGSKVLADVAAWASLADGLGDAALPLIGDEAGRHGMAPLDPASVQTLRAEALVGSGEANVATPFVIDAEGRFALWRNHAHEVHIAEDIRARRAIARDATPSMLHRDLLHQDIETLFGGNRSPAVQRQREAVAAVVGRHLFVLTGGPGTGKTTTVLRMLLALQRCSERPLDMAVAAPTGKAAQRLVQSLRAGKEQLLRRDGAPLPEDWLGLLERIPDREALTVHRLLGFDPRRNMFTRNAARPVAADIVVIDEASMLDLGMLRALLDAVPLHATLILVGDADQLTSVATGSVLMDLVGALETARAPELVRLKHGFRAEERLVAINEAVRTGRSNDLGDAFAAAGTQASRVVVDTLDTLHRELDRWVNGLDHLAIRPQLLAPPCAIHQGHQRSDRERIARELVERDNGASALAALRALSGRQLLCALREGEFGALAVNREIERRLKRLWGVPAAQSWYAGRAIVVTRNDYSARLFNGDVGLVLADGVDGALHVWFETAHAEGVLVARSIAIGALPPHEGAFALTIHKSQGSEFGTAAVLLPPDRSNRVLSRQLLYTGMSRAKHHVQLWATNEVVDAALARPVTRAGALAARLR